MLYSRLGTSSRPCGSKANALQNCVSVSVCLRVRSCLEYTLLLKLNMHTDGIGTKQIVCTVRIVKAQRQNANTHGLSACERVLHGLFYVPACMNVHTLAPRLKQTMLRIYATSYFAYN